jgi:uncharacterized membrane protein SpoIIM required for sporulation/uncharacterized RDD family membrane protein YckC
VAPQARVPPGPQDFRRQHGIETPEHVAVYFELAGAGSRGAAVFLDLTLLCAAMLGLGLLAGLLGGAAAAGSGIAGVLGSWALALAILAVSSLVLGYFTLFEALNGGRTPGKQALGIRVVMDTGRPLTPTAAVVRNLTRLADCFFPLAPVVPALAMIALHPSNKRLGDIAAGTIVVRDRPTDWTLGVPAPETEEPIEAGPPELTDAEFQLLDRFLARLDALDPAVRERMTQELARRLEARVPRRVADAQAYLVAVFAEEQSRRRSRFAVRARRGAAGRTTVTAERLVARKRGAWEEYAAVARRVERAGVGALPPGEIPAFAARYREVAADLARARTYGVDPRVIEYLERLVSAGHNALYRARGVQRTPVVRYVLRDFPAAVARSWRYVLAGALLFFIPAGVGYAVVRERPQLGEEVLPVMVGRAAQAAERQARGIGYAETGAEERPVLAAFIISNNVRVSFLVFAGGILAGTLTVAALLYNGLAIGMGFGIFGNAGALPYLTTFVVGHGVLELVAIFISAGAGFRIARAIIAPGDLARRDAIVVEGRIAAQMIGAVVTLLLVAGAIEGLLSASDAPAAVKYAVSGATVVLLTLYLWNGRRSSREQGARSSTFR